MKIEEYVWNYRVSHALGFSSRYIFNSKGIELKNIPTNKFRHVCIDLYYRNDCCFMAGLDLCKSPDFTLSLETSNDKILFEPQTKAFLSLWEATSFLSSVFHDVKQNYNVHLKK